MAIKGGGRTQAAKAVAAIAWAAGGGDRQHVQRQRHIQPHMHKETQRPVLPPSFTGNFHPFLHPSFSPLLTNPIFGCGMITISQKRGRRGRRRRRRSGQRSCNREQDHLSCW